MVAWQVVDKKAQRKRKRKGLELTKEEELQFYASPPTPPHDPRAVEAKLRKVAHRMHSSMNRQELHASCIALRTCPLHMYLQ